MEIALTRGQITVIDDESWGLVSGFTWHALKGKRTWYAVSDTPQRGPFVYMHRIILGSPPDFEVDHVDGNGLNNRRENLRTVTRSQQMRNARKALHSTTSRYKGVSWRSYPNGGGIWKVQIYADGQRVTDYAATERAAAALYNELAVRHFGEFANLNDL